MTINVKKSRFSVWKTFLCVFAMLIIAVSVAASFLLKDINGVDIQNDITLDIPEGSGSATVSQILYDNGVIKYPYAFRVCSGLGGFDGDYKPGPITIHNNMSYNAILKSLVTSERDTVTIVIPEGYTVKQIAQTLSEAGVCSEADFYSALDLSLYDYKFLENLPQRDVALEGYLFPATYEISPSYSPQQIVTLMLDAFSDIYKPEYYERAAQMNMSVDEIVTIASIIERETNADTERAKVAGVFYNRIKANQKLESCATVQYILGERKPVLSISDTQIDSPYNTYKYPGLPIGPIASPGEECIKAALYPEETDAFYFLLGANGEHIFSTTYEEHKKAMESNGL